MITGKEIKAAYKRLFDDFDIYDDCWMGHVHLNLVGELKKQDVIKSNCGLYKMLTPTLIEKDIAEEFLQALNRRTLFPYFPNT